MKTFTNYAEKKAKQFFNLLQGYTKGIRITAILVLLLMGVNSAWGATQRYIYVGISNNYQNHKDGNNFGLNVWGGTSGGVKSLTWIQDNYNWDGRNYTIYRAQVYDDNNKAQFKGNNNWWDPGDGFSVKLNGTTNNAIFFSHSSDGWQGQFQQNYQVTSSASLKADKTSALVGESVTLTPSLTSNTTYNTLKSTSYEISPNTGASISSNTFNATKAGTYTVTATVTYNAKDFTGITKTATATVDITVTVPTYTVTFNANGHGTAPAAQTVSQGSKATQPTAPTATGYTFGGWYKEAGCTNAWNFNTDVVTEDMILYAKWTATVYTITYNNLYDVTHSNPATYTIETETITFAAPTSTRTGYTFASWNPTEIKKGSTGNKTVTAQWTANQYDVELDQTGATNEGTKKVTVTYDSAMPSATMPERTGYEFGGYWTQKEGKGKQYYNAKGSSANNWKETTVKTLYAHWIAKTYTITYTAQGTGWTYDRKPTSAKMGDKVVFDVTPTNGYDVAVKSDGPVLGQNGNEYSFEMPAQNVAITVSATEKLTSVTLNVLPQGSGSFTVGSDSYESGRTVQVGVTTSYTVKAIANTGYTFDRWTPSGNASALDNGNTVALSGNGNGGTGRLNAYFTANVYTITFNKQEGTGGTDEVTVQYNNNNYSKNPVEAPKREGYAFGGYYSLAGGNGIQVVDANGKWTTNATGYINAEGKWVKADNVTLHAKWTESQAKHDVRVLYMCGDVVVKEAETIAVGEILPTSITAPAVTGYTFSEWKLGDGLVTENNLTAYTINLKTKSSGDYTLTANYIKYQYTLTFGVLGYGGSVSAIADGNEIASPAPLGQDSKVTLTATAKDGYVFHKWINSTGNEVSKANPYEHTMTESTTINAVFKNTRMLYLRLNDKWSRELDNGVWFAAYFFNTSNENYWVKMSTEKACEKNGYYKTPIPEGNWTNVIFVRMNKDNQTWLSFENKWDKTIDLTIPKDGKNLFTLYNDHEGENCNGTWSAHTSTYEPVYLTYNVEVPAGTPNCYISGEMNGWSFTEMEKVDDTHYTITIQDACSNDEYKYCYGPSWDCQEVKKSDFTAIDNRKHSTDDKVEAWIKYCLVGNNNIGWSWNDAYSFDIAGDMSHNFNANYYDIKVMSSIGEYYTHNEYKYNLHRSHTSVKIPHKGGENNQLILQADLTGTYKFHFDPVSKLLTIEFPEKGYRLKITMTDGNVYTSNAVDDETETLSFFAPGANDPNLKGTITLEHLGSIVREFTAPTITESGVYTAKLNSAKNGITDIALYDGNYYIRTDGANGGWSNYKTDSDNKMTYFVPREEEKYSYYWVQALPRAPRDHTNGVVNVKACVANDYNDNLAIMLEADKFTSDNYGNVNILDPDEHHREKINVRFGYNPKTNHFERAMLTGSGNINTFLNIFDPLPEGYLYKTNNNGTLETRLTAASQDNKFTDISNWVYERDVWVNVQNDKDVTVCLTAVSYNGARNSLFGFVDADQKVPTQRTIVAQNSTPGPKKMRAIYDFKTNRMIMAWMPGAYNCDREEALIADVLFMRHENDPVPQLTMKDNNTGDAITPQIKGIQTQFFALELENKGNQNYEEHYWITLPFNCIVGSISGVPGYMQTWGIQRYNGKKRAEKGWWKETETFWEWLGPDDVMEAGVGYVLSFDKKAATWNTFDVHTEHDDGSVTTTQKSLLRLYFPSTEKDFTFKANNNFVKTYADEPCEIKTANRHLQDGNWKIIGPLSYNSAIATASPTTGDQVWQPEENGDHITVPDGDYNWAAPMFLYEYTYDNSTQYNRENNWKYVVKNTIGYTYKAFFGYMVQFAGTMTWYEISQSIHPKLRARTYTDQVPTNITTNLELLDAEGVQHDQTFVALDVEGTTTYDLNKDLNKVFNNNFANIYTLSENIPFAGNTLPMEKVTVPVGVRTATAGEYTFRMPDGTDGISVTLVDNVTGTHTDMLMDEYTITLDAGTIENRFYLVVDPDRTATSVENIGEEAKGDEAKDQIKKFLIDGKLFIRTADGIFDAKGQRL